MLLRYNYYKDKKKKSLAAFGLKDLLGGKLTSALNLWDGNQ